MSSSNRRIFKGASANSLSLLAKTCDQIFIIPILLSVWSIDLYGEWLLISAIPAIFALSDFGFLQSASNELARRASSGSDQDVKKFFHEFTAVFTAWALFLSLIFVLVGSLIPLHDWLSLSIVSAEDTSTIFCLLILAALVSQNTATLTAGFRAKKVFHIGILIRAFWAFVRIFCSFVLVSTLAGSPTDLAVLLLLTRIVEYVHCVVALSKHGLVPSVNIFASRTEPLLPFLLSGMEFLLIPVAYAITLQGSTLLVGALVGPAAVAVYSAHRTVTRVSMSALQMFIRPLSAEAGLLQKDSDIPVLRRLLLLLSRATFWLSLFCSFLLAGLGGWIFQYWTHGVIELNLLLFVVLIIAAITEGLWQIASSIRLGTNRHKPVVWGFLFFSIMGLLFSTVGGILIGIVGVALGLLFTHVATSVFVIKVTVEILGVTKLEYYRNLGVPPVRETKKIISRALKRL